MEAEQRDISATILTEVPNTVMHRFVDQQKSLFTSGTCKIAKIQNPNHNTVFFINLNSFYYTLNNSVTFIRIVYDDTVSYLFPHFDTGLSSITLLKNSNLLENFEEILRNTVVFLTWEEAQQNEQIRMKLQQHCPSNIDREAIVCADKVKKVIKDTGKFLGEAFKTLGGYLTQGVKYVGQYIDQKVEEPNEKGEVNTQTKQKWDKLKKGTNDALGVSKDVFSRYLLPVIEKGTEYGKQIVKKIDESDNQTVKYAKELAGTSGQALNEAFVGLAQGTSKVTGQIGHSTRKIVKKKYGDDYVNTFIPENQKQQGMEQQTPVQYPKQSNSEEAKLYPQINDQDKKQ